MRCRPKLAKMARGVYSLQEPLLVATGPRLRGGKWKPLRVSARHDPFQRVNRLVDVESEDAVSVNVMGSLPFQPCRRDVGDPGEEVELESSCVVPLRHERDIRCPVRLSIVSQDGEQEPAIRGFLLEAVVLVCLELFPAPWCTVWFFVGAEVLFVAPFTTWHFLFRLPAVSLPFFRLLFVSAKLWGRSGPRW